MKNPPITSAITSTASRTFMLTGCPCGEKTPEAAHTTPLRYRSSLAIESAFVGLNRYNSGFYPQQVVQLWLRSALPFFCGRYPVREKLPIEFLADWIEPPKPGGVRFVRGLSTRGCHIVAERSTLHITTCFSLFYPMM